MGTLSPPRMPCTDCAVACIDPLSAVASTQGESSRPPDPHMVASLLDGFGGRRDDGFGQDKTYHVDRPPPCFAR